MYLLPLLDGEVLIVMEKTRKIRFPSFLGKGKKGLFARVAGVISFVLVVTIIIMLLSGHLPQLTKFPLFSDQAAGSISLQSHPAGLTGNGGSISPTSSNTASAQQATVPASSADITTDFGNRQNTAYPIPSTFLGVGGVGLKLILRNNGMPVLNANFHLTKLGDTDYMGLIFPTAASATNPSLQNWVLVDQEMTLAAQYNLQPLISLGYTPPWLQPQNQSPPQPNPCNTYNPPFSPYSVEPMYLVNGQNRGPQMWGQIAAQFVAHIDKNFPHSNAIYEIWNQPDGGQFLCMPSSDKNADQDRVTAYEAMYAAAAPMMKAQASKDGVQIKIGGPALVYALQNHLTYWLPTLLNNPAIYPYIDFFTYHRYLAGTSFNSGTGSLVGLEQDPNLGVTAQYEQVAKLVRSGKQPNASTTPIYIDEYSMSACQPTVCQNDPTYSPLMNALFIIDYLNAANDNKSSYGATGVVPAGLAFYSWDIPLRYLCMFGAFDAQMDCGGQFGTNIQPYPDYYTYLLFGGSNYLNITNGGYVATTTLVKPAGIYVCGLYSSTRDSVVVVNPTAQAFNTLHVFFQNPGKVAGTQASIFTLKFTFSNPANSITTRLVNFAPVSGANGYMATISVPAYTTVAATLAA